MMYMSRKSMLAGFVFMVVFSPIHGQSIEFPNGKTKTWLAPKSGLYDCIIRLQNIKGQDLVLGYNKLEQVTPDSWMLTFCTNLGCSSGLPDTGSFYSIKDREYAELKITIDTKGHDDSAIIKYVLWDKKDGRILDTVNYYIRVNSDINTNSMSNSKIRVYPNPAKDKVNVSGSRGGKIALYSGNGQILMRKLMLNNIESLDLSNVKPGLYLLTVLDSNGIHSEQLLIQ